MPRRAVWVQRRAKKRHRKNTKDTGCKCSELQSVGKGDMLKATCKGLMCGKRERAHADAHSHTECGAAACVRSDWSVRINRRIICQPLSRVAHKLQ